MSDQAVSTEVPDLHGSTDPFIGFDDEERYLERVSVAERKEAWERMMEFFGLGLTFRESAEDRSFEETDRG